MERLPRVLVEVEVTNSYYPLRRHIVATSGGVERLIKVCFECEFN